MTSDADVSLFGKLPFVLVVENEPVCRGDVAACVRAAQRCDRAVRTEAEHIVCQLPTSHTLDQSVLAAAEHEEALIEQRPLGCHVLAVAEKPVEGDPVRPLTARHEGKFVPAEREVRVFIELLEARAGGCVLLPDLQQLAGPAVEQVFAPDDGVIIAPGRYIGLCVGWDFVLMNGIAVEAEPDVDAPVAEQREEKPRAVLRCGVELYPLARLVYLHIERFAPKVVNAVAVHRVAIVPEGAEHPLARAHGGIVAPDAAVADVVIIAAVRDRAGAGGAARAERVVEASGDVDAAEKHQCDARGLDQRRPP